MLPFSREVYFSLFAELNGEFTLWSVLAGILACLLAWRICTLQKAPGGARIVCAALALLWAGTAYFWYFKVFAGIHFLAEAYGYAALLQSAMLILVAAGSHTATSRHARPYAALPLILLALCWPLIDLWLGPGWPQVRIAGLHALPLTLLTFAALLHLPAPKAILLGVIPALFSLTFAYQAYVLQIPSDWTPLAGALAIIALQFRAGHLLKKTRL